MSSVDYFHKLQERLGHTRDVDPKTLATDEIAKLGRALGEEHRLIGGGMNASGKQQQVQMKIMEFQQEHPGLEQQLKDATDIAIKCRTVGYGLQQDPPSDKKRRLGLRDEQWVMQREVASFADHYEGQLRKLWLLYADWIAREIHHYAGHDMEVGMWIGRLKQEFEKRLPGYKEKSIEELIEENAMSDEEFDRFFGDLETDEEDYQYSDAEIAMEVMEDHLRETQTRYQLLDISYQRLERIALGQEEASAEQIKALRQQIDENDELTILEYQDQLAGLVREVNEKFDRNLKLLAAQGQLEGEEIDLYFNGPHPRVNLAMRYGEDLMGRPKWRVAIKKHQGGNKYLIKRLTPPHNEYEIGLGFSDDDNHFFTFTFFNKRWGRKWMYAEQELGPPKSQLNRMRTYELIEVHHKINAHFEKKGPER